MAIMKYMDTLERYKMYMGEAVYECQLFAVTKMTFIKWQVSTN
jgi:hypothetical protein